MSEKQGKMMTFESMLNGGRELLEANLVPEADLNAWYLLQSCMGKKDFSFRRSDYFLKKNESVPEAVHKLFQERIDLRIQRIPLEYITGYTEFMGLVIYVNQATLIPRQDTEVLVEKVLPMCQAKDLLDLCSGSGCIGISLGVLGNPRNVTFSDISEEAMQIARENVERIREEEQSTGLQGANFIVGNLFENIQESFDIIVSNPPYIASLEIEKLMPEVREREPMSALDGGEDGLDFYRQIVKEAGSYLNPDGILCFEIGFDQGEAVSRLMKQYGYIEIEVIKDLAGLDRVVFGKKG